MYTDLLIIGGGINGAGIAVDAAGRGLHVTLCEQGDLACATSSRSSKLIHGGLRYLGHYEFRLVRAALKEREILLKKAPHLISPLRFIMPYSPQSKPFWLLRLGLFLYDHLAKRRYLPGSQTIAFAHHPAGQLLKKSFTRGLAYSDCWTDDARLVVLNAMAAREYGATILTRTRFVSAKRQQQYWQVELEDINTQQIQHIQAKALVNASGAWVDEVIRYRLNLTSKHRITLVKGSHIVVPKLYTGDFAFILNTADKRVVFVIPYLNHYSLIGTTDVAFQGDPAHVDISFDEIDYLCGVVNAYFNQTISREDIVWSYAGVRALQHDEQAENLAKITRDYALELNSDQGQTPLLSVFGGKITTYRKLAEHALNELRPFFPQMGPAWTATTSLPGGNIPTWDFATFLTDFHKDYPWLPIDLAQRYAQNYGTRAAEFLQGAKCLEDLGTHIGAGLYQRELHYLINEEWARTAEDVLWRRTKLGLDFSPTEVEALERIMQV